MAKFSFNGMDEISASLEQIANLTDEDKMSVILRGARLLLERQREKIASVFKQRTGALANSLTIEERSDDSGVFAYIFPKGKHPGSGTGKRMKKGRSSGKYSGSNAEVAYILEYGSPRIAATHWLENANEESADELTETMQSAWNDMLTEKGL